MSGMAANVTPRPPIRVRVKRQDHPEAKPRWEEFLLPWRPNMNVIILLQEIGKKPVTLDGKKTTPIAWEASCLEEVCGSCSMLVNGRPRQACAALVDTLARPITLEPFTKFPLVRDLLVDRGRMFESLKRVRAWIPIDGTYNLGPGPRVPPEEQQLAYPLSRCITCGCCLEACPQVNERSKFIGAAAISQVRLFNMHPTGAMNKEERLRALMGPGGVTDCGNAQNCVRVCPKDIPLTTSIAEMYRETTALALRSLFKK